MSIPYRAGPYPVGDTVAREVARSQIREDMHRLAGREAAVAGWSMSCRANQQLNHPHRCTNTGENCLCPCHDGSAA